MSVIDAISAHRFVSTLEIGGSSMFRKIKLAFYLLLVLLMLPFVALAALVMRRVRRRQVIANAVRVSRSGLETATLTFEKPDQDQSVKLHGMIHIGQPVFYRIIGEEINADQAAGHAILYERVRPPTDEEVNRLTRDERAVYESLKGIGLYQKEMADTLGLVHQMDALAPKDTWTNTDLTQLELIRLLVGSRLTSFIASLYGRFGDTTVRQTFFGTLFDMAIHSHVLISILAMLIMLPKYRRFKRHILDDRNTVAHRGIVTALNTHNHVNSIWGAAHLPGIAFSLKNDGFALTKVEWRTAFVFRQQSFGEVARALGRRISRLVKDWIGVSDDESKNS
ncbi:MAG: hypothetical protein V1738_06975 [Patescibacteria group bacterium]